MRTKNQFTFFRKLFLSSQLVLISSFITIAANPDTDSARAVQTLSEYIKIRSYSGNEKQAFEFLKNLCEKHKLHITVFSDSAASWNFAASLYPLNSGKPNLIFHNHSDVVHEGDSVLWKYPPFYGTVSENKIWGRGTADCKGLAIIQLYALLRFAEKYKSDTLPFNITFLNVSGEETGGTTGSKIVAEQFTDTLKPLAIIGEGGSGMENIDFLPGNKTIFGISVFEKSMLWLKVESEIDAHGHSSISSSSNANNRLINGLHRLVNAEKPVFITDESKIMFHHLGKFIGGSQGYFIRKSHLPVFRPILKKYIRKNQELESFFCNTYTITQIENPVSSPNQNSRSASAIIDCRLLPGITPDFMIRHIRQTLKDTSLRVTVFKHGSIAKSTQKEKIFDLLSHSLQEVYQDAGVIPMLFPASTDNSYFRGRGFPVYGLNPFTFSRDQLKAIHTTNEFIDTEDLANGIKVYTLFLEKLLQSYR